MLSKTTNTFKKIPYYKIFSILLFTIAIYIAYQTLLVAEKINHSLIEPRLKISDSMKTNDNEDVRTITLSNIGTGKALEIKIKFFFRGKPINKQTWVNSIYKITNKGILTSISSLNTIDAIYPKESKDLLQFIINSNQFPSIGRKKPSEEGNTKIRNGITANVKIVVNYKDAFGNEFNEEKQLLGTIYYILEGDDGDSILPSQIQDPN